MPCDICNSRGDVLSLGCFRHEACRRCWKNNSGSDINSILDCPICFCNREQVVVRSECDRGTYGYHTPGRTNRQVVDVNVGGTDMKKNSGRLASQGTMDNGSDPDEGDLEGFNDEIQQILDGSSAIPEHLSEDSLTRSKVVHKIDPRTGKTIKYFPYQPKQARRQSPVEFEERHFSQSTPINVNQVNSGWREQRNVRNIRKLTDSVLEADDSFVMIADDMSRGTSLRGGKMESGARGEADVSFTGQFSFTDCDAVSISSSDSKMLAEYGLYSEEDKGRISKSPMLDSVERVHRVLSRAANPSPPAEYDTAADNKTGSRLCRLDSISSQDLVRDTSSTLINTHTTDLVASKSVAETGITAETVKSDAEKSLPAVTRLLPLLGQPGTFTDSNQAVTSSLNDARARRLPVKKVKAACDEVTSDECLETAAGRKWSVEGPALSEEDIFKAFAVDMNSKQKSQLDDDKYDEFWDD